MVFESNPSFYSEWLDSYYPRDVQELFKVEKRTGFLKLLEIILQQSGGIFDAVSLSKSSGLSRPIALTYLEVFQLTHVAHILRPYHGGGQQEIVKQPKGRNLIVTHSQREEVKKKVDGLEIVTVNADGLVGILSSGHY